MEKILISLFDYTGNWSKPYRENGWEVCQVDIKHGVDIMTWEPRNLLQLAVKGYVPGKIGLLAAIPCTDYAVSGARHFAAKDVDGRTEASQKLVARTKEIIDFFENTELLDFWAVENPRSRIHTLNPWLGKPRLKFNPCDYAGYDPVPDNSRYNKDTWLWGNFKLPEKRYLEPLQKEYPGFTKLGGKSEKTKELRSVTPLGFSYAFYETNH